MGRLAVLGVVLLLAGSESDYDRWTTGIKRLTNDEGGVCTTFRIGVNRWLTAKHCIRAEHAIGEQEVTLMRVAKDDDIAELRSEGEIESGFIFKIADKAPEIGDMTVIIGFSSPAYLVKPVTFFGPVMGGQWDDMKPNITMIQAMVAPGGSGSPVLVNGKVVSITTGVANLPGPHPGMTGAIFSYGPTLKQMQKFLKVRDAG
jgi:hypothetical protein